MILKNKLILSKQVGWFVKFEVLKIIMAKIAYINEIIPKGIYSMIG